MKHKHVRIAVRDAPSPGVEAIPARAVGDDQWQLLRSPLYATDVASGDVVKILDDSTGAFEIVHRGGNVCVQFYLGEAEMDDAAATAAVAALIATRISAIGGRIDGTTPGLITCTVDVSAGFPAIEESFNAAAAQCHGSQWQFANVYDSASGEPLGWWS